MRGKYYLWVNITKACFLNVGLYFAVITTILLVNARTTPGEEALIGAGMALLPNGAAAWWLFHSLRQLSPKRDAGFVAITFAVCNPVLLVLSIPFAQIPGGYAGFLARPFGGLAAFLTIGVVDSIGSSASCALVLWLVHRLGRARVRRNVPPVIV